MVLRLALVALLALAGPSCSWGGDEAAVVRTDGSSGGASDPGGGVGAVPERELDRAEIDRRRSAWRETGVADYSYQITSSCDCDRAGTFAVTVVSTTIDVDRLSPAPEPYRQYFGQSIDAMFAMFDEALLIRDEEDAPQIRVTAAFDSDSGHPSAFTVRWDSSSIYHGVVSHVTPMDGPVTREPDPTVLLSVANESFSELPMPITITADGRPVVDAVFEAASHRLVTYELDLVPGEHELRITAASGAASAHTIAVGQDGPVYVRVTYWPEDHEANAGPYFSVDTSDEPPLIG